MHGADYLRAGAIIGAATVLCLLLRPHLKTIDVAMVFLLAVVGVASRYRQGPALLASVLSIAAFDFLFVPPYYTFDVHDSAYFLTFFVMLIVALLMSRLTARLLEQAEAAREREQRTAALYTMNRELSESTDHNRLIAIANQHIGASASGDAAIILASDITALRDASHWPAGGVFDDLAVRVAAAWAYEHGEAAGMATARCSEAEALVAPLHTTAGPWGVVVAWPRASDQILSDADRETVLTLVDQAAVAIERASLAERNQEANQAVEAERLRTALLSSLSHDLRTPLASIEGAASSLFQDAESLPLDVRAELAGSIVDESRRMTRLVTNLLDMVRVEAGALTVRKSWQPLEEALGVALLRLEKRLQEHPVEVQLPMDLPLVPIDELLIEQVFINLLENAARYTPPGTPIRIGGWFQDGAVVVEVADRGPGVAPGEEDAVFGRFYRTSSADSTGAGAGSGLGLTICRGILTAHGGRMWLEQRPGGGAAVRFILPLEGPPLAELPVETLEA